MTPEQSRRAVLASVGGALAAGLAGCSEVTSQEFAASPVRLPEAVHESLGLAEVFAESNTTTRERTVGGQDVEVTITNEFAGYHRTPPSMDSGWWVKDRTSLVERFVGFDPRSGSWSAINAVASELGLGQSNPAYVERDATLSAEEVTLVVPERARHSGDVRLEDMLAVHHAEALGIDEWTMPGGSIDDVAIQEALPDVGVVPAGWSKWEADGRWIVGEGRSWLPDDPSDLRCLVYLGDSTPEEVFGIDEMPGRSLEEGETVATENTVVLSPAPEVIPDPDNWSTDPTEVFDAGYPTPMSIPSYGLGVVATPNAEIAGESVNPLARIELRDLLTRGTTGDLLARAGLTDADEVEWLRGPDWYADRWNTFDTGSVLDEEVAIESHGGVVSGDAGPWAVAVHAAKAKGDDVVIPAAVHRRPVGTPDGQELFGGGTGFLDGRWTTRALELTEEVFASLEVTETKA